MGIRAALIFSALLVSACEELQPVELPPEILILARACKAGDTAACAAVSNWRTQMLVPPPVFQPTYFDPGAFQNQSTTTNCQTQIGGQITCVTN